MSKKLAIAQLALIAVSFIFSIIFIADSSRNGLFDYSGAGFIGWLSLMASIAVIVIAIIQIVYGAKEKNGVGMAAGITGVLTIIPFVGLASFILDIIVVARKS